MSSQILGMIPLKIWLIIAAMVVILISFAVLITNNNRLKTRIANEKAERERVEKQNEGLKILVNTATIAIETEKQRELANAQSQNTNTALENVNKVKNKVYTNTKPSELDKKAKEVYP